MARPYSMDLRERVVAAARFGVAASTAAKWLRRVDATGSVAPGQMGGHKPRAIAGVHREWLLVRCQAGAFTLRGLVKELGERGLKVDYRSVWELVHGEKLSYKKDAGRQRAEPPDTWFRLQAAYDLAQAMKRANDIKVERITRAA